MLLPRRLFHLRPRFTFLFHCGSFSPLCCDPALTVFASKCLGAILCHDGCSLRSRGSWLGGSLVSALSFVASAPSEVALCVFVVGCFVCFLGQGPALTWHRSCHLHASRCKMACAKDGTQAAIGIHLKSTLLSICPVFLCCFLVLLFFVCFAFCGFCFVCFLVGLCSLSAIG